MTTSIGANTSYTAPWQHRRPVCHWHMVPLGVHGLGRHGAKLTVESQTCARRLQRIFDHDERL